MATRYAELVGKLLARRESCWDGASQDHYWTTDADCAEAAAAITALEARCERLEEALRRVADLDIVEASLDPGWFRRHARSALASIESKP